MGENKLMINFKCATQGYNRISLESHNLFDSSVEYFNGTRVRNSQ